jgi:hypothetical protein
VVFSGLEVKVSITLSNDWGCDDVFLGGVVALRRDVVLMS